MYKKLTSRLLIAGAISLLAGTVAACTIALIEPVRSICIVIPPFPFAASCVGLWVVSFASGAAYYFLNGFCGKGEADDNADFNANR